LQLQKLLQHSEGRLPAARLAASPSAKLLWFCVPGSIVPARGISGGTGHPQASATSQKPPAVFRFDRHRDRFEHRRFAMRYLSFIGALAIVAAVAAAVFFFGGYYDVAATQPDPRIVVWAMDQVRTASINRHAVEKPAVSMEDPAIIQTGARAFAARGCTNCHGGPGVMRAKFSEGLRPDPPDLEDVVKELEPAQIFWVIRNGINMTGMPGFNLVEATDQEIWTIAAFVKQRPHVSDADYAAWTAAVTPGSTPNK
jgi:mono/diheme cytochrome c family protein